MTDWNKYLEIRKVADKLNEGELKKRGLKAEVFPNVDDLEHAFLTGQFPQVHWKDYTAKTLRRGYSLYCDSKLKIEWREVVRICQDELGLNEEDFLRYLVDITVMEAEEL